MRWSLAAASFWYVLSIALEEDEETSSDDDYTIFAGDNEIRSYDGTGQFNSTVVVCAEGIVSVKRCNMYTVAVVR